MSALTVDFPTAWSHIGSGGAGHQRVEELVAGSAELGPEAQEAAREYFTALLPVLRRSGVDSLGSLAVYDEETGHTVKAFCALGVLGRDVGADGDVELRTIVEGGPHPGLHRETTSVELPVGPALRSSAVRHATELQDRDGVAPYAAEVRYAFAIDADRLGVLHFETMSLVYLKGLTTMFDAIAGTTRVA